MAARDELEEGDTGGQEGLRGWVNCPDKTW